ncbi:MAG: chromosome segregation protein SMC [Pyrinomonadaceae bacterium]
MFRLQRLEITGFKSFADHTELVFTGDGITAVVGPNGCGKSNVADAISWVLGEQRAKQLRGAEMKDVIFQGSRNRQPGGMAEVVLHMVRVEAPELEHDEDIEDIDSTLEEIDEHAVHIEAENHAPANAAGISAAAEESNGQSNNGQSGNDAAIADTIEAEAQTADAITADAATVEAVTADGGAVVVSSGDDGATKKNQGKRHWRPSRLALEFAPGESVAVTRRLYRSGESEYLLNGRACRLRDIQDLFSGTGLSGAHYAIIEQGRIGQILSAKPMDRRTLIEEAAGITKFRVRQRAAEARLESARANLSRVNDIVSEIERQAGSLRRQAAKARRYRQLREELRELLRRVYVAEERSLSALIEETRTRLQETGDEERRINEELATGEEAARHATQSARDVEEELTERRAAAHDAALQRDRRQREYAYQQEQIAALERRRADVENEIKAVQSRLESVEADTERLREHEGTERAASEASAIALREAEAAYNEQLARVALAETEIETARAGLLTHTAMSERLMEIGRQLDATLERLAQQAETYAREGERAAAAHSERAAEAETLNAEIETSRQRLAAMISEREAAIAEVTQAREAARAHEAEHTRVRDEAARTRHRLDTLTELDAQHAHYSLAVQRLFAEDSSAPAEFHSVATLADVLQVEPQWERAVEGIFGNFLQTVIVPTPADALRAAEWLRANDSGRASFLVAGLHGGSGETDDPASSSSLNNNSARSSSGGGSAATAFADAGDNLEDVRVRDILNAPRELLTVMNRTLAEKMEARLSTDLDHAMSMSLATNEMYVTLEGDWVQHGQLVNAGDARALEEGAGLLAFKRELRELETSVVELENESAITEKAAAEARARTSELEDVVVSLNEVIGREERDAMARELNAAQLAQEIERAARHVRIVGEDAARLAEEQREVEDKRHTALTEAQTAEAARVASAEAVTNATTHLANRRREAEIENERLGEQRAAAAAAAERRRAASAELKRLEAEQFDLNARMERHAAEVASIAARLEELRNSMGEIEGSAESEEEIAQEAEEVANIAAQLTKARERADALALELAELNRRAAATRDARASLEVQRAESTARLVYVREACMSELNQSLEELTRAEDVVVAVTDDAAATKETFFDLEASRAQVEEMRARVEGFGAVNMMALEELAEAEERLQFLTTQRQDITDAVVSTEEALREIKRRSRERFRQAFEAINTNFGELFQELFGGGRGEMSLIDAEDVLESGIDLIAQPPGKRLQSVLLLSGGEKAMAALALVLAIFRFRPSPFCLLDEVDAPLDEANVGRFTSKIAEMAARTQFIVITHNKRTMEMARALYGVTMQEVGVSKLVSVKFE